MDNEDLRGTHLNGPIRGLSFVCNASYQQLKDSKIFMGVSTNRTGNHNKYHKTKRIDQRETCMHYERDGLTWRPSKVISCGTLIFEK
jgi:hypothetical protein